MIMIHSFPAYVKVLFVLSLCFVPHTSSEDKLSTGPLSDISSSSISASSVTDATSVSAVTKFPPTTIISYCPYDTVRFYTLLSTIQSCTNKTSTSLCWLETNLVRSNRSNQRFLMDWYSSIRSHRRSSSSFHSTGTNTDTNGNGIIQQSTLRCAAETYDKLCDVAVKSLHRYNRTTYLVGVNSDTSMPNITTTSMVQQYFRLEGKWGNEQSGEWITPSSLFIHVVRPLPSELIQKLSNPDTIPTNEEFQQYYDSDVKQLYDQWDNEGNQVSINVQKQDLSMNQILYRSVTNVNNITKSLFDQSLQTYPPLILLHQTSSVEKNRIQSETKLSDSVQYILNGLQPSLPGNYTIRLCSYDLRSAKDSTASDTLSSVCRSHLDTAVNTFTNEEFVPFENTFSMDIPTDECPCDVQAESVITVIPCPSVNTPIIPSISSSSSSSRTKRATRKEHVHSDGTITKDESSSFSSSVNLPIPMWQTTGILGIGGSKGIRIPHNSLPRSAGLSGSWTMSFWIWLWDSYGEDSTTGERVVPLSESLLQRDSSLPFPQKHRILFFKGMGGSDQGRTPSAWFHPNSNKLILRSSTLDNPDIGADSISSMPVREWVHLTFTFGNHSYPYFEALEKWSTEYALVASNVSEDCASKVDVPHTTCAELEQVKKQKPSRPSASFTYKMYINGNIDSVLVYNWPNIVYGNNGTLYIGKHSDFPGAKMLVGPLQLFENVLTDTEIELNYRVLYSTFTSLHTPPIPKMGIDKKDGNTANEINIPQLYKGIVAATRLAESWGPWYFPRSVNTQQNHAKRLLNSINKYGAPVCALCSKYSPVREANLYRKENVSRKGNPSVCQTDPESIECERESQRKYQRFQSLADMDSGTEQLSTEEETKVFAYLCTSSAEAQAWSYSLEYSGISMDQEGNAVLASIDGIPTLVSTNENYDTKVGHDHSYNSLKRTTSIGFQPVVYEGEWYTDTATALDHAINVLKNCSTVFDDLDASKNNYSVPSIVQNNLDAEDSDETKYSKDSASTAYYSNSTELTEHYIGTQYYTKYQKRYYSSYLGAIALLESACAGGSGNPSACRYLAEYVYQPARDNCPSELRKLGKALRKHRIIDHRSNEDSLTTIMGTFIRPLSTVAEWIVSGLRSLHLLDEPSLSVLPTHSSSEAASMDTIVVNERISDVLRRDTYTARQLYASAAMRGDAHALYMWGIMIITGTGAGPLGCGNGCGTVRFRSSSSSSSSSSTNQRSSSSIDGTEPLFVDTDTQEELDRIHDTVIPSSSNQHILIPSADDTAFGLGLIHLASAAGEPFAWQFLARRYSQMEGSVNSIPAYAYHKLNQEDTNTNNRQDSIMDQRLLQRIRAARSVLQFSWSDTLNEPTEDSFHSIHPSTTKIMDSKRFLNRYFSLLSTGVPYDIELAAWYSEWAADIADSVFHSPEGRPHYEYERLTVDTADSGSIEEHQRGDDEPVIAYQRQRADAGDIPAMMNTADLLYWGARGLERNFSAAFYYYEKAAKAGHVDAMVRTAEMLLKGEGTLVNFTQAIEYYKLAGSLNNTKALNGLGYAYFFGQHGIEKNHSKAYNHFYQAATQGTDSDSLYNAGHCLDKGIGTSVNRTLAKSLYETGVKLGHFGCIQSIGRMHAWGTVPQSFIKKQKPTGIRRKRNLRSKVHVTESSDEPNPEKVSMINVGEKDTAVVPDDADQVIDHPTDDAMDTNNYEANEIGTDGELRDNVSPSSNSRTGSSHRPRSSSHSISSLHQSTGKFDSNANETGTTNDSSDEWSSTSTDEEAEDDNEEEEDVYEEIDTRIRNPYLAFQHLEPAATAFGPWAKLVRKGFERYLIHDYDGACLHYLHGYLMGYEVSAANAAYLLQRRLADWAPMVLGSGTTVGLKISPTTAENERLYLSRLLWQYSYARGGTDSILPLADHAFMGTGGTRPDIQTAIALYARASAAGSAQAAYNLAYIYEIGAGSVTPNLARAERYYRRVFEITPKGSAHIPVYLALARMRFRAWMDEQLMIYTNSGWIAWLTWFESFMNMETNDDIDNTNSNSTSLYWNNVKFIQNSWSIQLFNYFLGDDAPNAKYEQQKRTASSTDETRKESDPTGDESFFTKYTVWFWKDVPLKLQGWIMYWRINDENPVLLQDSNVLIVTFMLLITVVVILLYFIARMCLISCCSCCCNVRGCCTRRTVNG